MVSKSSNQNRETAREKLVRIFSDHAWHTTKELVRHAGHTFHVAIFHARRSGHAIERRRHPTVAHQHQYRAPDGLNG